MSKFDLNLDDIDDIANIPDEEILNMRTEATFDGLTSAMREILDIYYDNDCAGYPEVARKVGCTREYVYDVVKSKIGREYISYRMEQDSYGKISKSRIIQEYKNLAFVNFDDFYETKIDEETGEQVQAPINFSKLTRRERRRIRAAGNITSGMFGDQVRVDMRAKVDALNKLMDIAKAISPDTPQNDTNKSILDRIKRLSGLKKDK